MNTLIQLDLETLPARFIPHSPVSDCALEALCESNDLIYFERTREGEILMQAPAGGFTGDGNAEITTQLRIWWKTHRQGRVFDSSEGFYLPDGSMLNPDAAYVSPERLLGKTSTDFDGFPRLCPDFVVELLSKSDRLNEAKAKMVRWIENGAAIGWLVDPYQRVVLVYGPEVNGPGHDPVTIAGEVVEGTGPIQGFNLDLNEVWSRYEL